jgi:hypothetical protein
MISANARDTASSRSFIARYPFSDCSSAKIVCIRMLSWREKWTHVKLTPSNLRFRFKFTCKLRTLVLVLVSVCSYISLILSGYENGTYRLVDSWIYFWQVGNWMPRLEMPFRTIYATWSMRTSWQHSWCDISDVIGKRKNRRQLGRQSLSLFTWLRTSSDNLPRLTKFPHLRTYKVLDSKMTHPFFTAFVSCSYQSQI